MRPFALVESPLQVLGLVDAIAAGFLVAPRTVVRSAPAATTLAQLCPALARLQSTSARTPFTTSPPRRSAPRTSGIVLGDALSGQGQLWLVAARRSSHVLLLDDGTATLRVVDALLGRGTLARWVGRETRGRRLLATAALRRLRAHATNGTLTLRTCIPLPDNDVVELMRNGVAVVQHRLDHVRALGVADTFPEDVVILGSALADDGLIDRARYDRWAERLVDEAVAHARTVRYLAHRREPRERLERLARAGARTTPSSLPAELSLSGLGPGRRLVTLPTSVLLTVGGLLTAAGVEVDVHDVPDAWWTPHTSPSVRAHLSAPSHIHAATSRPTGGS